MSFRPFTPVRKGAAIPMFRVKTDIHITVELSMAVKPRASADEETAAVKPFGAIVTVWSTVIRISIEVAIGTNRGHPDTDANLCIRCWTHRYQTDSHNSGQ